jgi:hypothetical protein
VVNNEKEVGKMSDIKRCPVAFNLDDPIQRSLYEHSQNYTNFSAYVKWLIQRDIDERYDINPLTR